MDLFAIKVLNGSVDPLLGIYCRYIECGLPPRLRVAPDRKCTLIARFCGKWGIKLTDFLNMNILK